MGRPAADYTGHIFGRLCVLHENLELKEVTKSRRFWDCKCICGKLITASQDNLRRGHTQSCGCLAKEGVTQRNIENTKHGYSHESVYRVWACMKQRCYNPAAAGYIYYGGSGITVCDEWLTDPAAFCKWANENGYGPNLTIDRIDGTKNYRPDNCRWITQSAQTQNRRKVYTRRRP